MTTALVVEDSLTDKAVITDYLQRSGISVTSAASSEEALKILEAYRPDLVFLDVVLPGQSGFEFCHSLKNDERTRKIPVVICSNKDTKADKLWGSMLGADAYLAKPITEQQLVQTLAQLIS